MPRPVLFIALLLACVFAPIEAQQRPHPPAYRILICNDVGVRARKTRLIESLSRLAR